MHGEIHVYIWVYIISLNFITDFIATRECLEGGVWNSPDVSNCKSAEYTDLETEVQNVTSTAVNITTLITFTSELSNITSVQQEAILPQDVVTASNILTMIIE